jgi:signal transduction histidine kinase
VATVTIPDSATVATTTTTTTTSVANRRWLVLAGTCALVAAATGFLVSPQASPPTTYGVTSFPLAVLGSIAGYGLLAAATFTALVRPRGSVAAITGALGIVWLANDWIGWPSGPTTMRSIAMVLVPFVVPLVFHLALAWPSGRVSGRLERAALGITYLGTVLVSAGRAMFRDPFLDLGCWNNCRDNIFLVTADRQLVATLDGYWRTGVIVVAALTVAVGVARLVRASSVARRGMVVVVAPTAVAAVGNAWLVVLVASEFEDPTRSSFRTVFLVRAGALVAIVLGVAWGAWKGAKTRAAIARLAHELGTTPAPGSSESVLSRSFGDETLGIAYWLPVSQRWVDATGCDLDPQTTRGRASTTIVRDGEPVAELFHDPDLSPPREVGAAARLAIDNERLRAEVLAQLRDLRASRARIVTTSDVTRRQLERDLHDGAQQRILAASFELRQACAAAIRRTDDQLTAELEAAIQQVQVALTELREVAHGIFPSILSEAGLDAAVRQLADRSPIAVEAEAVVDRRFAPVAESSAYTVLARCVESAPGRASAALVSIVEREDQLTVAVTVDGVSEEEWPSPDLVVELGDRVGAIGGEVTATGTTVRAEIPCAS